MESIASPGSRNPERVLFSADYLQAPHKRPVPAVVVFRLTDAEAASRRYRIGGASFQGSKPSMSARVMAFGRFSKMWRTYA
jgi:hypothetical protein